MTPLAPPHHATLQTATAFVRKVDVLATRGALTEQLKVSAGQFTADARRSLRWGGKITIPGESSLRPIDILTPFGTLIEVRLGIVLNDESESTVPFGLFTIADSKTTFTGGSLTTECSLIDLGQRIALYRFERPFPLVAGLDLAEAVNKVVADRIGVDPGIEAVGENLPARIVFGLDPQTDPWRELSTLAASHGYRLYYDRAGGLILDQAPEPNAAMSIPFHLPTSVSSSFDEQPPNVIVARGEAAKAGQAPVQAVEMDLDPGSPTYAGESAGSSPYGRVTEFYASPLLTTESRASAAARSILAQSAGAGATWQGSRAFDPTFDPDDVIAIETEILGVAVVVVDAVTVDIDAGTSVTGRGLSLLA